jgi:hypothetical protein
MHQARPKTRDPLNAKDRMAKKKRRKFPWAGAPSSSLVSAPVAHGAHQAGSREEDVGPSSTVRCVAQGVLAPSRIASPGAWEGWCQGVASLAPAQAHVSRLQLPAEIPCSPAVAKTRLGFPPDFVGAHSFPHCAAFLSRLWSLPVSSRSGFHGGWCITSLRPPMAEEEWPRLGSGGVRSFSMSGGMDPKNKNIPNPPWDRWGQKDTAQGSQSWNRNRNLSWRLKSQPGKSDLHEGLLSSSSGDGIQSGNPIISPFTLKKENDPVRPAFCQKCGVEGHHARNCFNALWCDICRKDTHVTSRCVLPKQSKPNMPIVGMAADGLGFYLSHFAKPMSKKPKRVFIVLVKVIEGLVYVEDLENDFGFHFPWGKMWKATKCHSGFLMQFPSQECLDEMMSFPELKMKMSGAKIVVVPWSSRAKPKSRLHTAWVVAENVPEELKNYQSIYEIGSMIGAVEEVDLMSLDSEDIVRFKVHIKSVAMIPPVVEVAVKPFLYDIYFRIESISDEGWNDETVNLGKRASVDIHGINDPVFDKSGKKPRNEGEALDEDPISNFRLGESSSQGKESLKASEVFMDISKDKSGVGLRMVDLSDEKVDFDPNEDDLLSSQELEEFAKEVEEEQTDFQARVGEMILIPSTEEEKQDLMGKKSSEVPVSTSDGVRKSSRLEKNDDIKVADKAISRAEAKDAFLNKGMNNNSFSLLDANNEDLLEISNKLGVYLGPSKSTTMANLDLIKELELSRKTLAIQSCKTKKKEEPLPDDINEMDSSVHADSDKNIDYDFLDVMVLRKGRKIKHRKNSKKKASPKFRCTPNRKKLIILVSPHPF